MTRTKAPFASPALALPLAAAAMLAGPPAAAQQSVFDEQFLGRAMTCTTYRTDGTPTSRTIARCQVPRQIAMSGGCEILPGGASDQDLIASRPARATDTQLSGWLCRSSDGSRRVRAFVTCCAAGTLVRP